MLRQGSPIDRFRLQRFRPEEIRYSQTIRRARSWSWRRRLREPPAETPWVKFVKSLEAFRLWFNTRSEELPMEEWGEDALRALSNELQWFMNLRTEIGKVRATTLAGRN